MTGIDGIEGVRVQLDDHAAMDQQLPGAPCTLEAEYFVEWQVADIAPLLSCGTSAENQIPFR